MTGQYFDTPLPIKEVGSNYTLASLDGTIEIMAELKGFEGEPYCVFNYKDKKIELHRTEFDEWGHKILVVESDILKKQLK